MKEIPISCQNVKRKHNMKNKNVFNTIKPYVRGGFVGA